MKVEVDVNIEWVMSELAKLSQMESNWGYPLWLEAVDPSTIDLGGEELAHIRAYMERPGVPPLIQTQRGFEALVEDIFSAHGGYSPSSPSHIRIMRYLHSSVIEVQGKDGEVYCVPNQDIARSYCVPKMAKDVMPGRIDRSRGGVIPDENDWCVPVGPRRVWKLEDEAVLVNVGPQIPETAKKLMERLKTAPDEQARRDAITCAASFIMGSQDKGTSAGFIRVPVNMLKTMPSNEVTIVGTVGHYEIWDRAAWEKMEEQFAMEDLFEFFNIPQE